MSTPEDNNPFHVGQRVRYPIWDRPIKDVNGNEQGPSVQEGAPFGIAPVLAVLGPEYVRLDDSVGWHVSWLEPEDEFVEWIREVRNENRR
jgi:hypothetical protein